MGNQFYSTIAMKTLLIAVLLVFAISTVQSQRRRGRGKPKCSDGSEPLCSDGSSPVMDGDRNTPPCPDGGKPNTCADGSAPTKGRPGGGRPGGRCPKEDQVCCDGSTPVFDGDKSTPPCADGSKPKCSADDCRVTFYHSQHSN